MFDKEAEQNMIIDWKHKTSVKRNTHVVTYMLHKYTFVKGHLLKIEEA